MSYLTLPARSPLPTTKFLERRSSPRYQASQDIACNLSLFLGDEFRPARVLDVSQGGLGLLVSEPVALGTFLMVRLANAVRRYTCRELVSVRHVTERLEGDYHVGCEFVKKMTLGDLRALLPQIENARDPGSAPHAFRGPGRRQSA